MAPQLVIARYNENISWVLDSNLSKDIIIYNKGVALSRPADIEVVFRPNKPIFGREAETYLYHIVTNYDKLNNYTIFTQANPFDHNAEFLDLILHLNNTNGYRDYQPLTYEWDTKNFDIPPNYIINYDKSLWIDNKYKIYMETADEDLCAFGYKDTGFYNILNDFKQYYKLENKDKALPFLYEKLNINKIYPSIAKFNFGAIFGVKKENILQHPLGFYQNLHKFSCEYKSNAYILERLWYTIFN